MDLCSPSYSCLVFYDFPLVAFVSSTPDFRSFRKGIELYVPCFLLVSFFLERGIVLLNASIWHEAYIFTDLRRLAYYFSSGIPLLDPHVSLRGISSSLFVDPPCHA